MVNPASLLAVCSAAVNPFPVSSGFDVAAVVPSAKSLPVYAWSIAAASEALLELYNPELSVFGASPFPVKTVPEKCVDALQYTASKVVFGTGPDALVPGLGSTDDAAGLGVNALLLAKTNKTYVAPIAEEISYLTQSAPRWSNGAISHRADVPELWVDFIYMAPPFLAYAGADQKNLTLLQLAYQQIGLYRDVLKTKSGAWSHIIGPQNQDTGLWSTGNGFAVAGIARVLATVIKAPVASSAHWRGEAINELSCWSREILDGVRSFSTDDGLLRNYLNDTTWFGETAGTSLIAAATYRLAVLRPAEFGRQYISWADGLRTAVAKHITNGTASPADDPLNWLDTVPYTAGSPDGQNFVLMLYAAYRDCVQAKICSQHK